jgi:hypothetical protein
MMEYKCTNCGAMPGREHLLAKKVLFTGMGAGAKTHRSRVVGHLCVPCVKKDPVYNLEPYVPAYEKTSMEAVDASA